MFGPVAASVFASAMNTTANTMRYSMNTSPRSSRFSFSVHVMFASVRVASYEQASCLRLRAVHRRARERFAHAGANRRLARRGCGGGRGGAEMSRLSREERGRAAHEVCFGVLAMRFRDRLASISWMLVVGASVGC